MPKVDVRTLAPAQGMKSRQAALFFAQLEGQLEALTEDTRGATPEELEWQPAPGMNTMGMLLAHIAKVEAGWIGAAARGLDFFTIDAVPVSWPDTGIPLPADAAPPAALAGKDLAFYDGLLARARAFSRECMATLTDADLETRRTRTRRDGTQVDYNVGWALYHALEHFAGHYGQVNLLRHQYRMARAKV
jgi:uncharacterized damage-inducible protein DinB